MLWKLWLVISLTVVLPAHAQTSTPPIQIEVIFSDPEIGLIFELIDAGVRDKSATLQQSVERTSKASIIYDKLRRAIDVAQQKDKPKQ